MSNDERVSGGTASIAVSRGTVSNSYVSGFGRLRILFLILRLLPFALRQATKRQFFVNIPEVDYEIPGERLKPRMRMLVWSIMYAMLLRTYTDSARTHLRRGSQHVLFLMVDLIKGLDDSLDGLGSLSESDALASPLFVTQKDYLSRYLRLSGSSQPVVSFLKNRFSANYATYIEHLRVARETRSFEDVLKVIEIDSLWLTYVMEVVAIYNGPRVTEEARADYYRLGVVGKFADDMYDAPQDFLTNDVNLLLSLAKEHGLDQQRLAAAVAEGCRIDLAWWRANCPTAINDYYDHVESFVRAVRSPRVRLICDLVVGRAVVGRSGKHDVVPGVPSE
jgi:hypothetical protein